MIDLSSTFTMSIRSLRINKMRSILTSLGIIIGVSAVIIMLSIGEGAKQKISKDIQSVGSNILMVMSGSSTSGGVRAGSGTKPTITIKDARNIEKYCDSVAIATPIVSQVAQVVYSNQNWSTSISGVEPDYMHVQLWEIADGRTLTPEDIKNSTKVALIGETVATNLFGDMTPLNKTIRIAGIPFKVVGLLKSQGQNSMGHDKDDTILIPLSTAQRTIIGSEFPGTVKQIIIQATDSDSLISAQNEVQTLLRERHHITKNKDDDFTVRNFTQMLETIKKTTSTMTMLLGAIASVSLLVGGIGIMNIMLVSVTERTREIGIRMAIGAKAMDIRIQFLIEALVLSFIGGFIGILIGLFIVQILATFTPMSVAISMTPIILSFGFSGLVGVIFGYYPAFKASNLNPIEALRYE